MTDGNVGSVMLLKMEGLKCEYFLMSNAPELNDPSLKWTQTNEFSHSDLFVIKKTDYKFVTTPCTSNSTSFVNGKLFLFSALFYFMLFYLFICFIFLFLFLFFILFLFYFY
jgi:hypothetical protein